MKSILACSLGLLCAVVGSVAHEFWLEPARFFADKNQLVRLQIRVGENFTGESWEAGPSRITHLTAYHKKGRRDWLKELAQFDLNHLDVSFKNKGTHLVALATNSKYIELDAPAFNEYLKTDGLEHILEMRKAKGQLETRSREQYCRQAITLVQVGSKPSAVDFTATPFDLKIIPDKNPYDCKAGQNLGIEVSFQGRPLANGLVVYWNKYKGQVTIDRARADADGKVQFRLHPGDNMISIVHMTPCETPATADWQSYWGSVTFAVKEP